MTNTIETADGLDLAVAHHRADGAVRGTVLLAHGITRDMDEGGMFSRLADRLTAAGFDVVRFSYRGHGRSDGRDRGLTVGGAMLDFEAAVEHTRETFAGPYFVVAKSFGAVSTCLSLSHFGDDIGGLVLWNPVLDVEATFLDPQAPWGVENFTGEALATLHETGTLAIDGEFEMGRVLWAELHRYDPGARFAESDVPALVVHGDADDIVPYADTKRVVDGTDAAFHTIENTGHGFQTPDGEPVVRDGERAQDRLTVAWLRDRAD